MLLIITAQRKKSLLLLLHTDLILIPPNPETYKCVLPHDPGHQHHGGLVEGVKELDEDLSFLTQLPQSHAEHNRKHHQTENIHAILIFFNGNLRETHTKKHSQDTEWCICICDLFDENSRACHLAHLLCDVKGVILENKLVVGCVLDGGKKRVQYS